jgi:membrane protease YdiL (CAAX protease family)
MEKRIGKTLGRSLLELCVYAVLVTGYYLLVLKFLGGWLYQLFQQQRQTYAGIALGLIIAQGFVLEILTRGLLGWIKPRREDE